MITFDKNKKYVLAVSGGIDSMVMLHSVASIVPRPKFSVVTVNHNLRDTAQSDCDFVVSYCNKLGVKCTVVSIDVNTYANQHKLSTETSARVLRYQAFDKLPCDYVCLAHHADDNVETILMHLLRGSGANGITGIKQINGKYVRPLLTWTRTDIETYAKQHNVPFVTDITNSETKYTRNFVRHKVLPVLTEVNPNAKNNILRFANSITEDDKFINTFADISTVKFDNDRAQVPLKLLALPRPVATRIIYKVFNKLGVFYDIEHTHVTALIDLANNVGGKKVDLPFGYSATNDYNYVTIERNNDTDAPNVCVPFAVGTTVTPLGAVNVTATPTENALRFDLDKVPADAVIRTKRQGDIFCKFGGGTKPLTRYLIDRKVPSRKRDRLLVVASGNNVLIICGIEISDQIKVDKNSNTHYIKLN